MSEQWEIKMRDAVFEMLHHNLYFKAVASEHIQRTPLRVVEAFKEYFAGCEVDTGRLLTSALFLSGGHAQMIAVKNIVFHSVCAHHLALVSGIVHFAYIPKESLIGISKIPKLIDAFARRPQVQEIMSNQIVDEFMKYVSPVGCGIFVRADHACMQCRGARAQTAYLETTALRGVFLNIDAVKQEFLMMIERGK